VVGVEGHVREPLSPAALPRSSTRAASLGRSVTNPKVRVTLQDRWRSREG